MLYGGMPYYNWWESAGRDDRESAEEVGGVWFSERVGGWGVLPFARFGQQQTQGCGPSIGEGVSQGGVRGCWWVRLGGYQV